MIGWHHWHNGHGFGWTPGVGDGQGGLAYFSSWGCKDSDMTKRLNWTNGYKVYEEWTYDGNLMSTWPRHRVPRYLARQFFFFSWMRLALNQRLSNANFSRQCELALPNPLRTWIYLIGSIFSEELSLIHWPKFIFKVFL